MSRKAIITIDTEGPIGNEPIEKLVFGKTPGGEEYGIRYLMELFDRYNAKGLFFVDIAEAWDYGENKIAEVLKCISESGHDVGVHIHPDHMADRNRKFLWEYTYDEQFKLIQECTEFYEKVLGKHPISFRAGRYGANDDTIKILDHFGYKYDMSEFVGNRRCRMTSGRSRNRVRQIDGSRVLELPVSVFKSFDSPIYSRVDKIDVSQSLQEYKKSINAFYENDDTDIIVFFIHSFSLLYWRRNPNNPRFNRAEANKVDRMIQYLKESNISFIEEQDLPIQIDTEINNDFGMIDISGGISQYRYFLKRGISNIYARIVRNV